MVAARNGFSHIEVVFVPRVTARKGFSHIEVVFVPRVAARKGFSLIEEYNLKVVFSPRENS